MPIEKKIIIFDLDGVLINSLRNMQISWNLVSRKYYLNISFQKYKQNIGLPFETILKKLNIQNNIKNIKQSYNYNSTKNFNKIKLYPNVVSVLKYLKKKEYLTAVITSKDKERANKIIKLLNLNFKYVYTPSKLIRSKPYPDQILKILKKEKIKKKNCYYVGDMSIDAKFAKNAGVNFIFTKYGYESKRVKSKINLKSFNDLKKIF